MSLITERIWLDKDSEYYNKSVKSWLKDNDIEIYSEHNEGKPVLFKDLLEP